MGLQDPIGGGGDPFASVPVVPSAPASTPTDVASKPLGGVADPFANVPVVGSPAPSPAAAPDPFANVPLAGASPHGSGTGESKYGPLADAAARRHGIDPRLMRAQIMAESEWNPRSVSSAGAKGIAQFMDGTGPGWGVHDPFDVAQSLEGMARFMRHNLDANGGDVSKALAAYNAGQGNVHHWQNIPETRAYVAKILRASGLTAHSNPAGPIIFGGGGSSLPPVHASVRDIGNAVPDPLGDPVPGHTITDAPGADPASRQAADLHAASLLPLDLNTFVQRVTRGYGTVPVNDLSRVTGAEGTGDVQTRQAAAAVAFGLGLIQNAAPLNGFIGAKERWTNPHDRLVVDNLLNPRSATFQHVAAISKAGGQAGAPTSTFDAAVSQGFGSIPSAIAQGDPDIKDANGFGLATRAIGRANALGVYRTLTSDRRPDSAVTPVEHGVGMLADLLLLGGAGSIGKAVGEAGITTAARGLVSGAASKLVPDVISGAASKAAQTAVMRSMATGIGRVAASTAGRIGGRLITAVAENQAFTILPAVTQAADLTQQGNGKGFFANLRDTGGSAAGAVMRSFSPTTLLDPDATPVDKLQTSVNLGLFFLGAGLEGYGWAAQRAHDMGMDVATADAIVAAGQADAANRAQPAQPTTTLPELAEMVRQRQTLEGLGDRAGSDEAQAMTGHMKADLDARIKSAALQLHRVPPEGATDVQRANAAAVSRVLSGDLTGFDGTVDSGGEPPAPSSEGAGGGSPTSKSVIVDDPDVTSLTMATRQAEAERFGTAEPQRSPGMANDVAHATGKAWVENGGDVDALLTGLADDGRAAKPEEAAAILEGRRQLVVNVKRASQNLEAAAGTDGHGEALAAYEGALQAAKDFDAKIDTVKGAAGSALQALKIGTTVDLGDYAQVLRETEKVAGGDVDPKLRDHLKSQVDALNAALDEQKGHVDRLRATNEALAKAEAEKVVRTRAASTSRGSRRSTEAIRADRDAARAELRSAALRGSLGAGAPEALPDYLRALGKIAATYIEEGVNSLADIVARMRADLKEDGIHVLGDGESARDVPEGVAVVRERDIYDAIAGKGDKAPEPPTQRQRDAARLRAMARIASTMHEIAEGTYDPKSTGKPVDAQLDAMRRQLADMKEDAGVGRKGPDPLEAVRRQYEDALHTLAYGPEDAPPAVPDTPEVTALRARVADLRAKIRAKFGGDDAAARLQRALDATQARLDEKTRQLTQGYRPKDRPTKKPTPEALAAVRSKLADVNRSIRQDDRLADLEDQIRTEDYTRTTDARDERAKARAEREAKDTQEYKDAQRKIERARANIRYATQAGRAKTWAEKAGEWSRTSALSGVGTFLNLTAAVGGHAVLSPIEELMGPVVAQTVGRFGGFAEKAGAELRFDPRAEMAAIQSQFSKANFRDKWEIFTRNGHGEIADAALANGLDRPHAANANALLQIEQATHEAFKTGTKRNAFARGYVKALAESARRGLDVNDNGVKLDAWAEGYSASRRALFLNDTAMTAYMARLKEPIRVKTASGKTIVVSGPDAFVRVIAPVTHIPLNIAARSFEYTMGIPYGLAKQFAYHGLFRREMTPEAAQSLARAYKRGGVGLALFVYAARNQDLDVDKEGRMTVRGHALPHSLGHIPALASLKAGVYYRRAKTGGVTSRLAGAALSSAADVASNAPFMDIPRTISDAGGEFYDSPERKGQKLAKAAGKIAGAVLVPQGVQQIAKAQDTNPKPRNTADVLMQMANKSKDTVPRKASGFLDSIQADVPAIPHVTKGRQGLPFGQVHKK